MINQSFTEFRAKKQKAEQEIIQILNSFSKEFDLDIESVGVGYKSYTVSCKACHIVDLNIQVKI